MEDTSMEGMWMHSKPVFVSLYCTCIRPKTRLISVLMACGGFVDVVATLAWQIIMVNFLSGLRRHGKMLT